MFDVMENKWIPVVTTKNEYLLMGVRDCLVHAHEIKCLRDVSHINILNYCSYSFLIDIAQDIFRPTDQDDIAGLYRHGSFDEEKIDKYIKNCEKSGVSFDIFDDERPFLQCPRAQLNDYDFDAKKHLKSVATLGYEYESGNNALFRHRSNLPDYDEYAKAAKMEGTESYPLGVDLAELSGSVPVENTVSMDMTKYVMALIYMAFASQATGRGCSASVSTAGQSGYHPIFVLNEGNTLFETLVGSMGTCSEETYEKAVPMWRWENYTPDINTLKELGPDGYMAYSYYPTKCIYPADSGERVKAVYNKSIDFKEMGVAPKALFSEWVLGYPRIIKEHRENKDGEKYTIAMVYHYNDFGKSTLKTMLIDLAGGTEECPILAENYRTLKEKFGVTFRIRYFAFSHNSGAAQSNIDCQETFEWDFDDILDKEAQENLRLYTIFLKAETFQLGRILTAMDVEAVGAGMDGKMGGKVITKLNAKASTICIQYISEMEWELLHTYRKRLNETGNEELKKEIIDMFHKEALKRASSYNIARNDLITRAKYTGFLRGFDCTGEKQKKKKEDELSGKDPKRKSAS